MFLTRKEHQNHKKQCQPKNRWNVPLFEYFEESPWIQPGWGGPTADRSNRRKWRSIVPRSVLLWPAAKHATGIILLFKKWKQCFNTHFVAWRLPSTTVGKKMDITLARWVKSMEQQKRGSRLLSDYAGLTPWFVTSARKLASYVATLPSERWSRGWTPELLVIFFLARWYGCYWASKLWLDLFHLKLFVIHVSRAHNKQCMQHPAFPAFFFVDFVGGFRILWYSSPAPDSVLTPVLYAQEQ